MLVCTLGEFVKVFGAGWGVGFGSAVLLAFLLARK
jgi:hypothetical protein